MDMIFEQMEQLAKDKLLFAMKNGKYGKNFEGEPMSDSYFRIRVERNAAFLGNRQGESVVAFGVYGGPGQYGIGYWDIKCEVRLFGKGFGEMKAKAKKGEFDISIRST